jgi:hypothetical protein
MHSLAAQKNVARWLRARWMSASLLSVLIMMCLPCGGGVNIAVGGDGTSGRDGGMTKKDMNNGIVDWAAHSLNSNQTPIEGVLAVVLMF